MTTIARDLVAFVASSLCWECDGEMVLQTTGRIAYAISEDSAHQIKTLVRDRNTISAQCPRRDRFNSENDCHGQLVWDITDNDSWVTVTPEIADLLAEGNVLDIAGQDCPNCQGSGAGRVTRDPHTNQGVADDCGACEGTGRIS